MFWKEIWEKDASHNVKAMWIAEVKADHQAPVIQQQPVTISEEDLRLRVMRIENWTYSGPNIIYVYWLKKLASLHIDGYMHKAQRGIGGGSRGSKHQMLIDQSVAKECWSGRISLTMAWINYKKTYDSVPHALCYIILTSG